MQITSTLMTLAVLAVGINAVPLNINLGAYSPALVVGDGEISFGGEEKPAAGGGGAAREGAAVAAAQVELLKRQDNNDKKVEKRQNGFDRALQFAEVALTKGPTVQLGTGAKGAGVGIIVDPNAKAAGGAAGGKAGGEAGGAAGGAAGGGKAGGEAGGKPGGEAKPKKA